ncbi:hypothetical protein [Clostridium sp. JN-1]|nr:hypothetical protein [Clostridium sp. JN-1]
MHLKLYHKNRGQRQRTKSGDIGQKKQRTGDIGQRLNKKDI